MLSTHNAQKEDRQPFAALEIDDFGYLWHIDDYPERDAGQDRL